MMNDNCTHSSSTSYGSSYSSYDSSYSGGIGYINGVSVIEITSLNNILEYHKSLVENTSNNKVLSTIV